ncbi:TonB-dependent receptor [Fluviicola taffensis]|uniref:TonB-dependent receptor plug n=1 Tax=Fluviicola taffensis (strain DSM 16823 / NCIMB 13979 / RW262) TaxID=755732 RepID=F2IES8_FLUTR|nr:TonB-dependent receptor plug domain-containing protein [Fluviicola taffensis]AEA45645.1 TonB-dependent receptor plug [Fluviicola taffensis DSM 16823]
MKNIDSLAFSGSRLVLLFSILLLSNWGFSHGINGIVTDQQSQGISGAKVTLKGNPKFSITNGLGEFVLTDVHLGDSIFIESQGFQKRFILIDNEIYFEKNFQFQLVENSTELSEVKVTGNKTQLTQSANINLTLQPVRSAQELLTLVPGLFVAQHAGGGKAEQLFLRGFDIDHGTDVALSLDGMPVNMVSHAHGQGYADFHFVMPEVVDKINFEKGPYDVTKGDLATAGSVDFQTKEQLAKSFVALEYGMFQHKKITAGIKVLENQRSNAYFTADYLQTDNFFVSPQDFKRINLYGKYTGVLSPNFKVSFSASTFQSSWNASGQIPDRAVADGSISRFGSIDNTEGGNTSRTNVQLGVIQKINASSSLKSDFYASFYDFSLFSNFTFFLEDSINGDQIHQYESRKIYGGKSEYKKLITLKENTIFTFTGGAGFRYDDINNIGLAKTTGRIFVRDQVQLGNINQTNIFGYVSGKLEINRFVLNIALRGDNVNYYYNNLKDSVYQPKSLSQAVFLPKLTLLFNATDNVQLYLKSGIGYHSNDARVLLSSDNLTKKALPLAYGSDLGATWKLTKNLLFNGALWYLFSEQEFVYVGDAGIVEPSGQSQRLGFDVGLTFQPYKWLFLYSNLNYSHARSVSEPKGQNFIPLAPTFTSDGKVQLNFKKGIFTTISYRYMGHRAANEDNSVIAKGYFVNDFTVGYQRKSFVVTAIVNNIFNVKWNETQFLTESRLKDEAQPVSEIHFTPGTPFSCRLQVKFMF